MRSVVVVLPASMCAMIPMFRVLASSLPTSATATIPLLVSALGTVAGAGSRLPAVVREGLVGLRHLVYVLASLDAGAEAVARVQQLVHEPLGHGLLPPRPAVGDQPAQRQGGVALVDHLQPGEAGED